MSKGLYNLEVRKLVSGLEALQRSLDRAKDKQLEAGKEIDSVRRQLDQLELCAFKWQRAADGYRSDIEDYKETQVEREKRSVRAREKKLEKRIAELEVIEAEYNKLKNTQSSLPSATGPPMVNQLPMSNSHVKPHCFPVSTRR